MNNDVMFSSETGKWDTPQDLIKDLSTVFDWDLDVCSERPNVCNNYIDEEMDALGSLQVWTGLCWMNPPYGRNIGDWIERAKLSAQQNNTAVVCLVPSRTDTKWWHNSIPFASQVVFIKGRLKFGDAKNSAPFPSTFVVFGEINKEQQDKLNSYGWNPKGSEVFSTWGDW